MSEMQMKCRDDHRVEITESPSIYFGDALPTAEISPYKYCYVQISLVRLKARGRARTNRWSGDLMRVGAAEAESGAGGRGGRHGGC